MVWIDTSVAGYVDAYVHGWAVSRGAPRPRAVEHGWHVATGFATEPERFVLPAARSTTSAACESRCRWRVRA